MNKLFKLFSVLTLLSMLVTAVGFFPVAAAPQKDPPVDMHCPDGGTKIETESGSQTIDGVTVTWGNSQVTVTGGSAVICVKAATSNSGQVTIDDGETWSIDWLNNGGQTPAISYIVIYSTTPPPPPEACSNVGAEVLISDSGWVLAGDGLSRTDTKNYGKPDLDYPGTYCDTRTESQTEYLTEYCVDGENVMRWPSEMGDADPGSCVPHTSYSAEVKFTNNCAGWTRGYNILGDGQFVSYTQIDSGTWPGAAVPGNPSYSVTLPDQTTVNLVLPALSRPDNCTNPPPTPETPDTGLYMPVAGGFVGNHNVGFSGLGLAMMFGACAFLSYKRRDE